MNTVKKNFPSAVLNMYYLVQSMNDFAANVDKNIPNVKFDTQADVHLHSFMLRCQERPYLQHLVRCADELRYVVNDLLHNVLDIHRMYGIPIGIEQVLLIVMFY